MKALILDGSSKADPTAESVYLALEAESLERGWEVEHVLLREQKIGSCAGDYVCWIRTPGVCNIDDDNRRIARAAANSDLLVFLTPVTFGGYSSTLKRAVDHLMQNSLPFFKLVEGEIHHPQRYEQPPNLLVIGWMDAPQPELEDIFHCLVRRNAIAKQVKVSVSGVVYLNQAADSLARAVKGWVSAVAGGVSSPIRELPALPPAPFANSPIHSGLLLSGSPRGRKSSSQALGGYLLEQLNAGGIQVETVQLYQALGSPERIQALLDQIDSHDLTVLAFPLYIDSLPGPVTRALELIAAHRTANPVRWASFAAVVNSGFPEASQSKVALAICAAFARQAGFNWAGGLALGAGEAIIHGKPLNEMGRGANSIRAALELAAESLAKGEVIPAEAVTLMAKPRIPKPFFILAGGISWKLRARKFGAANSLLAQPYQGKG